MTEKRSVYPTKWLFPIIALLFSFPLFAGKVTKVNGETGPSVAHASTPALLGSTEMETEFVVQLSGLNELPVPVTTLGRGTLTASLEGNTLTVSGEFSGLNAAVDLSVAGGAHLHAGLAGQSGGVEFLLNSDLDADMRGGVFSADSNVFELSVEQLQLLNDRGLYVNIHTIEHSGGELRGQLVPAGADDYKMANLLGINENPSVHSPGIGAVMVERFGNTITVSGAFSGLMDTISTDLAGGAHIHQAIAGRNGPVIFPLALDIANDGLGATISAEDNSFELTAEQLAALDMDMLYINIHSGAVRSGELRGQIKNMGVTSFYANLSGHQARPLSVNTPGNGRVLLSFDGDSTMTLSGSVNDLLDTVATDIAGGAHLHLALAGSSGPVVFPLVISAEDGEQGGQWLPQNNSFTVTEEQIQAFYAREFYVNVHTGAVQGGEVRGQVMNLAKGYYGANLNGVNVAAVPTITTANGFVMIEATDNQIVVTGAFADLRNPVRGNAQLRRGSISVRGAVDFRLNAQLAEDGLSGGFPADVNQFNADSARLARLAQGGTYFTLSTSEFTSGAIRGQLLRDDNAFPTAPEIITPEDSITIIIAPEGSDVQSASFTRSSDPNTDSLIYILELAAPNETEFEELLTTTRVGTDTSYVNTLEGLYDTLRAIGFRPGLVLPIIYRFRAIDGSLASAGGFQSATVMLLEEQPQVVGINEIAEDGKVELINLGTFPVNFGELFIGIDGVFSQVDGLEVICGDLIADPGEQLTINLGTTLMAEAGELAISTLPGYGNMSTLLSYVVWGMGDRTGEPIASDAGIWIMGTELLAPTEGTSIQLIASPTERVYAHGKPTPCEPNTLTTGTDLPEAADQFSVYPNPFTQLLTVEVNGLRGNTTLLQLLDITGRLITEQTIEVRSGRFMISTADVTSGTYLLRLTNDGGSSSVRLVK